VREALERSVELGVKEYYFTGGEPFMHREVVGILQDALAYGPATVLTNATLLPERRVSALARAAEASPYSLEIRVSLDGVTAARNDAIRGAGTFRRALQGVERLVAAGFLPIITAMQSWEDAAGDQVLAAFRELLAEIGYDRPRLKILPALRIGAESERTRGYLPEERVTHEMLHGFDLDRLLCTRARLITSRGVYACPILPDYPSARLGRTLAEAMTRPAPLVEAACFTCYQSGAICANVPSGGADGS
jgi:MoaA/NifB/PqqE/SkfB family radical SAM enzyme